MAGRTWTITVLALSAGFGGCDAILGPDGPDQYRAELAAVNGSGVIGSASFSVEVLH